MDLMEAIAGRRSVRAYTGEPLTREQIQRLLEAAVLAPSGMNTQPWVFGVVQDAALLRDLNARAKAHLLSTIDDASPLAGYRDNLANPDTDLFYGAPALVVVYAKPAVTSQIDGCLAAQNIMLAAYGMGLGTCWIGLSHGLLATPEVKAELGVPAECALVAPVIVGKPADWPPAVERQAPQVAYWR